MSYEAYHMGGYLYDIQHMNKTYGIPAPRTPEVPDPARPPKLKEILLEEISELDEIHLPPNFSQEQELEYLISMSDLLADLVVYCFSEATRHGIPLNAVLFAVMKSNFTKLGADGKPIHDPKTNKFLKGPNYKPPEPDIQLILQELMKAK